MATESAAPATIVASFADVTSARRAVASLAALGITGATLIGADDAPAAAPPASRDRSLIWRIFWAGLIWGAVGAFVGAGIGVVLAMIGFPTDNMAIQIASWAMFVHIAATLWAAYAVIYDGSERDRTPNRPRSRDAMVIVRSRDPALLDRAERVLTQTTPTSLRRD